MGKKFTLETMYVSREKGKRKEKMGKKRKRGKEKGERKKRGKEKEIEKGEEWKKERKWKVQMGVSHIGDSGDLGKKYIGRPIIQCIPIFLLHVFPRHKHVFSYIKMSKMN